MTPEKRAERERSLVRALEDHDLCDLEDLVRGLLDDVEKAAAEEHGAVLRFLDRVIAADDLDLRPVYREIRERLAAGEHRAE